MEAIYNHQDVFVWLWKEPVLSKIFCHSSWTINMEW